MRKSSIGVAVLLWIAVALISTPASATVMVYGDNNNLFVSGTNALPAVVYGYNATNAAIPSSFNSNFLVKGDGTGSSAPITFSTAPYTNVNNKLYFVFVLDSQENPTKELLSIDNITITVNGNAIWSTTEAIILNPGAPLTITPQSNGADMAFLVPVAAFNGLGLTGSSTFIFTATHSQSSGGNEEWQFTDKGVTSSVTFFTPGQPIQDLSVTVPEPSTVGMMFLALGGGIAYSRRRR